ncbi:MAG: hypothetical protein JW902_00120 [Syntrophaceae bacterium]|nr:hypothetical protein [Syntrophaceae bacterium]
MTCCPVDLKALLRRPGKKIGLLTLAGCLILLICTTAMGGNPEVCSSDSVTGEEKLPVLIEQNPDLNTTIYSLVTKDCTIKWIARNCEIGVIKHWSRCTLPLAEQTPSWKQIAQEFFSHNPNAAALRTLFWGRLDPDVTAGNRELSLRLAVAAHQSPDWDLKRGKPKNGDINGFVKDLANQAMIYPELKAVFSSFNKNISFVSAEKVLVTEAARLPFYDQLKQRGIRAKDRLPFDCMAWFSVSDLAKNPLQ